MTEGQVRMASWICGCVHHHRRAGWEHPSTRGQQWYSNRAISDCTGGGDTQSTAHITLVQLLSVNQQLKYQLHSITYL